MNLRLGDCVEVMAELEACSVDAIVTDPPYELGFMGKRWDASGIAYSVPMWRQAYRVLKPGGHLVAFGGTRTYHRMAVAIEDAGFEIRDSLMWLFGSGFPKSLDVSKAIDRAAGVEREIIGRRTESITAPATDLARQWGGWGTALKPAYEPIVLARKPLRGTVAQNVTAYGTGALNIDGTRIGTEQRFNRPAGNDGTEAVPYAPIGGTEGTMAIGRWPANVIFDEEAAAILDAEVGDRVARGHPETRGADGDRNAYGSFSGGANERVGVQNTRGGPSRFFYTAKTSRAEREAGVEGESVRRSDGREKDIENPRLRTNDRRNHHPTVKPVDLMRWLCRLVTPPGGVVLDPFMGSGSTGMAALDEGFGFIGIEREPEYIEIARDRIEHRHLLRVEMVEPDEDQPQGRLL